MQNDDNESFQSSEHREITAPDISAPSSPQQHKMGSVESKSFLKSRIGHILIAVFALILVGGGAAASYFFSNSSSNDAQKGISFESFADLDDTTPQDIVEPTESIDYTSLPLGDEKYDSKGPVKGYVYTCSNEFNGVGASEQGPWINSEAGTWDLTKKISVDGSVSWPNARWDINKTNGNRVLTSADLPTTHNTGTYPISSNDEAHQYDSNPNSISKQDITLTIPLKPTAASSPQCIGGEVGVATTGVLIFSAFDAGGRDAVATEVQDGCQGHPQQDGYYHYHGYSSCFNDSADKDEHSELLGYAFDGYGIYGIQGEKGEEMSSDDLDACHGHTHSINWDGNNENMYHYHFTQDFPYTVSCFMGEPAVKALSTGESIGEMMGNEMKPPEGGPQGPADDLPPPPGSN